MKAILLSIKPKYVKQIIDGSKIYEYRKVIAKEKCEKILIYSTYPVCKIVASARIEKVLRGSPASLWENTKEYSGICYDGFMKYFDDKETAYAYKLSDVHTFDIPHNLCDYGIKKPPQSFLYINIKSI